MHRRVFRRIKRGLLRAGPLLLLAALLPGLSAIDHWGPGNLEPAGASSAPSVSAAGVWHKGHRMPSSGMRGESTVPGDVQTDAHTSHCHFNPAACSDQPLTANANAFPGLIELPASVLATVRLYDTVFTYHEFLAAPLDHPPQSA